ncbi:E3 ubiquitin-protein ligase TRIM11-like [Dromiciops gliroides]|uniref:E3 ubiquitin-protein ligase TRIM11-like n=1 Tax=Dromiciops gliroides TaxID=33562 RepID=UPI001CC470B8|nr:E3 ubiquitin-protein ligase TRIM11-like [Dromiciops gliroides]
METFSALKLLEEVYMTTMDRKDEGKGDSEKQDRCGSTAREKSSGEPLCGWSLSSCSREWKVTSRMCYHEDDLLVWESTISVNSGGHRAAGSSKSSQVDLEASQPGEFTPSQGDPQRGGASSYKSRASFSSEALLSVALKSLPLGCCRKEAVGERRMAAAGEKVQRLQKEITCGTCRRNFSEAVTMECRHSFCQACLNLSCIVGAAKFSCPECKQVPQVREFPVVTGGLAQLTEVGKDISCHPLQSAEGQSQCATHKEVLKLFCEDDQTAICVRCSTSPEHGAHVLSPIEEAVHRCREKLQHILSQVEKHLEEGKKLLAQEEDPAVAWDEMIRKEYCRLNRILKEEFQCLKERREEKKTSQDRPCQDIETLKHLMLDLQEACHQPNADLLQDVKQLLGRSESVLSQRVKAVTPEMRDCVIPGMVDLLSQFRVDITMDPTSASPSVIVSEDLKSVKAAEDWQVDPENADYCPLQYVFAEQAFSGGRHYWEVDVSQLPQWILGIQAPNRRSGRRSAYSLSSKFLLRCVKIGDDSYLQSCPGSLNHRVKSPVARVGVYLDYMPGYLVFYNVLQRSLIYRFFPILFTDLVKPLFFPGPLLAGTEAGPMTLCPVEPRICDCHYRTL